MSKVHSFSHYYFTFIAEYQAYFTSVPLFKDEYVLLHKEIFLKSIVNLIPNDTDLPAYRYL